LTAKQDALLNPKRKDLAKYTMAVAVMMTGVAAYRIRKFEEYDILKPARTDSRQRLYSDSDIELIHRIVALEKEKINLAGIKAILELQKSAKI
jgi:MerR family transcriptional regulator, glutamine synthetase repressor